MRRIVIVGASLAGHHTASTLRRLGYDGAITIIGQEPHAPYDRYPLSKGFLTGQTTRAQLDLNPIGPEVDWRLGQTATALDLVQRRLTVDGRAQVQFDGLVIATGVRPRALQRTPSLAGAFVLRTVEDAAALREVLAAEQHRVVVVGGGLIGAEVASVAAEAGHDTTLVHSGPLPMSSSVGTLLARHLLRLHHSAGVRVECETRVLGLGREHDRVANVQLVNGRRLPADTVVLATGTVPNIEWLKGSGIRTANGVLCGSTLHTRGTRRVVAAGDVARVPHVLLGGQSVRLEHWASVRHQAELAATNLLAGPQGWRPWTEIPTFGTTIHGEYLRCVGFPSQADRSHLVWGSLKAGSAGICLSRRGRVIAAIAVNAEERISPLLDLVRQRAPVSRVFGYRNGWPASRS